MGKKKMEQLVENQQHKPTIFGGDQGTITSMGPFPGSDTANGIGDVTPREYKSITIVTPNFTEKVEKNFEFCITDPIWHAKQKVLIEFASNKDLVDALNFGFYQPPSGGRAGKFLNEERTFKDYPMDRMKNVLEFRYKRRIFRHLNLQDEKKLQKVNTKKYRKKFFENIYTKNAVEMEKMLLKGLDPNYHDEKSGETPLTAVAMLDDCMDLLKLLVQYGAYLDFRTKSGKTALHNVAIVGKDETLKHLLDLGASPNYKDSKGLTPLYHSILAGSNPLVCELLLKERSQLGVTDLHGSEEIHQACKLGYVQHTEHLVYYGANVNARTASGNTPLHICALENQESCARVLLFRGADRKIPNYAHQTAYDIAILSNNLDVAFLLDDFDERNVTLFKHKPEYIERKRLPTLIDTVRPPSIVASPTLSNSSSGVETTSETSSNQTSPVLLKKAISTPVNMHTLGLARQRKASTGSLPETVEEHSESESDSEDEDKLKPVKPTRTFSNGGIGTRRSPAPIKKAPKSQHMRTRLYASVPDRNFVAIKDYEPVMPGEIPLKKGDPVDVLYVGEGGFWEGTVRGRVGWFPSLCVQEVKKGDSMRVKSRSWLGGKKKSPVSDVFAPFDPPKPRSIALKKNDQMGYGFQMRGANSHVPHIDFEPTPQFPALQYIGEVDKGGVADKAGLRAGDFVLEINNENVVNATHSYAVSLISRGGKSLQIKVITVVPESGVVTNGCTTPTSGSSTPVIKEKLPKSTKTPPPQPPMRSSSTVLSNFTAPDDSVLTEGTVASSGTETVVLDTNKAKEHSSKGMWSGNAFRLQGDDVMQEEDISTGIVRKQNNLSNEAALSFDKRFKSMTQQLVIEKNQYSASNSYTDNRLRSSEVGEQIARARSSSSISSNSSNSSDQENRPRRKPTPPGYNHTMDNLRRGRANSLGRGDNARPPVIIKRSQTEEYSPEQCRMNGNSNNRHSMYEEYGNERQRQMLPDKHPMDIPQHYATARRYNRNDPTTAYNYPTVQYKDPRSRDDPRLRGRPQSELMQREQFERQMRGYGLDQQTGYNTLQPRHVYSPQHHPQQHSQHQLHHHAQQRRQETVLEKHQRKYLGNDDYNRQLNEPVINPNEHYQPAMDRLAMQTRMIHNDGLLRHQDQRRVTPSPTNMPVPRNIPSPSQPQQTQQSMETPPPPLPTQKSTAMPPPPPPPPPPPVPINNGSQSNGLNSSIANAALARSMRTKNESIDSQIQRQKIENGKNSLTRRDSSEASRLSGSSISLDSSSSKDSGFENSDVDHNTALAQAIAARAAKLSNKDTPLSPSALPVTKEVPEPEKSAIEETSLVKPSDMVKQLKNQNNKTPKNEVNTLDLNPNDIDNGYSSPTSSRPRTKSGTAPPVKQKPKRVSVGLSEDSATALLDGVLADAEASIDYDLISDTTTEKNNNNLEIKKSTRIIGNLSIVSGADNSVLENVTKPTKKESVEDELPPPPTEFLCEEIQKNNMNGTVSSPDSKSSSNFSSSRICRSDSISSNKSSTSISSTRSILSLPTSLQDKYFMDWTCAEVAEWLEYLMLAQYKDTFMENDIEGKHLPDLNKDELKELGVKKLGHRMTLDDAINKLKNTLLP